MIRLLATGLGLVLVLALSVSAGQNADAKAAVHVLPHDPGRTCENGFPAITACEDIIDTYDGCDDVDIFPVFFDLVEYQGIEYGVVWPGSGDCAFTSCSDLTIGDIVNSGDGISHAWMVCQGPGQVAVTGWGWISGLDYGSVCIVAHPQAGGINIGDCGLNLDHPIASYCAGLCGKPGDLYCGPVLHPLGLGKSDGRAGECVLPGDSITYTISYNNSANTSEVNNVAITDHLPPEVDHVSSTDGGAYDPGEHAVVWSLGTLPAYAEGSVSVVAAVQGSTTPGMVLANTCEITGDGVPTTEVTEYTDVCPEFVPLNLAKSDGLGGGCVVPGTGIAYTITYDNALNPTDVHNVTLTDHLPPETEYVSSTDGGAYDAGEHTVLWTIGTLPAGDGGYVGLEVSVDPGTTPGITLVNTCEITSDETPFAQVTEYTDVCLEGFAPLILTKSDRLTDACACAGDSVTYTIIYDNTPNILEVHNVTLTDQLPAEMDYLSCSGGGTYEAGGHTITWNLSTVPAGLSDSVQMVVQVGSGVVPGQTIMNTCNITSDETPASEARDSIRVCSEDFEPLDLSKTDPFGGSCVDAGANIRYTISYGNTANSADVHNVTVVDRLPSATNFVSATGGGTYNAGTHTVTWDIGTVAGETTGSVEVVANVPGDTPRWSMLSNECEITSDETGTKSFTRHTLVCGSAGNPDAKVAVHVEPHASRSCTKGFPAITTCGDIQYTVPSMDVDAFPVFFDLLEYQGLEYGMIWPGQYSCVFTSCSDLTIGGITHAGDGISHAWFECQPGPVGIPGWAWIYEDNPCMVCVVAHPEAGGIAVGDCQGGMDIPWAVFCAGIAGANGDDPCAPTGVQPTSWGAIKAMFK